MALGRGSLVWVDRVLEWVRLERAGLIVRVVHDGPVDNRVRTL